MKKELLGLLADPVSGQRLELQVDHAEGGEIVRGTLHSGPRRYAIINGIPRFVLTDDHGQQNTAASFAFKWSRRDTYDSPAVADASAVWMTQRYGFSSVDEMRAYFAQHRRVLDAGCGSGFSSAVCMAGCWSGETRCEWYGVEISNAIDVALERLGTGPRRHFIQGDILQLPLQKESFDLVFSE